MTSTKYYQNTKVQEKMSIPNKLNKFLTFIHLEPHPINSKRKITQNLIKAIPMTNHKTILSILPILTNNKK
jgi:hypothetical protein